MGIDFSLIGSKIQQQRRHQKKTQENMADALNVSVSYISQIERGVTKISLDTLKHISEYLNCSLITLLEDVIQSDKEESMRKQLTDPVYMYMKSLLKEEPNEYNYRDLMLKLFLNCTKSEQRIICYLLATYICHK